MINRFKIYPEHNLGVSKLEPGSKCFEEVYSLAEQFRQSEEFPLVHYQVTDMRGCQFQFGISRLREMMQLIKRYDKTDNQKIGVYVIDNPLSTALVHLFFASLKRKRFYCSTIEKAYSYLPLNISFEQFARLISI